jgi:Leucine Rich repeats (2 copies)/Leucine Rich repeat
VTAIINQADLVRGRDSARRGPDGPSGPTWRHAAASAVIVILMGWTATGIAQGAPVVAPKPSTSKLAAEIREQIERLGHDSADIRQIATRRLVKIGAPAVKPLAAVLDHRDLEVRYRARLILLRMCLLKDAAASTAALDAVQELAYSRVDSIRRWASPTVAGMREFAMQSLRRQGVAVTLELDAQGELLTKVDMSRWQVSNRALLTLRFLGRIGSVDLSKARIDDAGLAWLKKYTHIHTLDLRETQVGDAGLKHLARLTDLVELDLRETRVTGNGLKHLASLKMLERLHLGDTQLAGAGLKFIARLPKLSLLNLSTTKVTDADLAPLASCRSLERLWLSRTQIGDEGLKHLRNLKNLRVLFLSGTNVTDAGLRHLRGLKSLESLWLTSNKKRITPAGVAALQKALPNAKIRY